MSEGILVLEGAREPFSLGGGGGDGTAKCLITFFPATYWTMAGHNGRFIKW